jgi:hypothetical protein
MIWNVVLPVGHFLFGDIFVHPFYTLNGEVKYVTIDRHMRRRR